MKSRGSNTPGVAPSRYGVFNAWRMCPLRVSDSRAGDTAGRVIYGHRRSRFCRLPASAATPACTMFHAPTAQLILKLALHIHRQCSALCGPQIQEGRIVFLNDLAQKSLYKRMSLVIHRVAHNRARVPALGKYCHPLHPCNSLRRLRSNPASASALLQFIRPCHGESANQRASPSCVRGWLM